MLANQPNDQSNATSWRQRLLIFLMSAFLVWHTLALVLGPSPDNDLTRLMRAFMQPYLTLLRLDNQWEFFAQRSGEGSIFRYDINDASGHTHTFFPAQKHGWLHPNFFWFRSWYYRIIDAPEIYGDYAVERFCEEHAALRPVSISLYEMKEQRFTRDHFLTGQSRTSPNFVKPLFLLRIRCPSR